MLPQYLDSTHSLLKSQTSQILIILILQFENSGSIKVVNVESFVIVIGEYSSIRVYLQYCLSCLFSEKNAVNFIIKYGGFKFYN